MAGSAKRASDAMSTDKDAVDPGTQVVNIPNNLDMCAKFIVQERLKVIQRLCLYSSKFNGIPDPTTEQTKPLLPRLEVFMRWLESEVEITPALKERSKIHETLGLMFRNPKYHFEKPIKQRARQLYEKWEAQNWGQDEVVDESSDDDVDVAEDEVTAPGQKRRKSCVTTASSKRNSTSEIIPAISRPPPANHPIFGVNGIMHGVMLAQKKSRKDYILDSRYPKCDAKAFGHNNLQVGSWWPMQIVALLNGAHGSKMGGIAGDSQTGAYSVMTSGGQYEDLDQDNGNVLYYSGSSSHDNTDPKAPFPSSNTTLALKASQRTGRPVRVLRAAGAARGKSTLRPTVGIRYDGLYQVVAMSLKTNTKSGLDEQFRLERMGNQPALNSISTPTAAEIRD